MMNINFKDKLFKKSEKKDETLVNVSENQTSKKKLSNKQIISIVVTSLLALTHVVILLAIILSFRYYSIYPALFGSVVAIIICILIIIDIVYFVGFNHRDLVLKYISGALAALLFIGGTFGSVYVSKANKIVNSVLGGENSKYETYSGAFVYDKNDNQFESLADLNGKTVGFINESSNGLAYIATDILKNEKIDYATIYYNTNAELVQALLDEEIDVMVITSAYRNMYSLERDENSPFAKYLDDFVDLYTFSKEVKVESNKKAKNVSTDPFNVLLIGYSRTDIGSPVGLADSIILATINPQTYTVSMMSIARDSFVPIPCYGGEYDKINSGRSTSRACFIETVENFIGMDIDYYMELDYLGLVFIVNTIGGVKINNPVDFELDGIYVPAGSYVADGMQALEFCRERHHMPNGDFDRQQHQKEVIIEIAKTFIESGDVSLALQAMDNAAEWMSTDLTLNQLTSIFNLLLNTKNYTGMDTFDLVDFQTLRMTGNGGLLYYSQSMHLPLWVYLIYQGSYDESIQHINDVLGNYSSINQQRSFEFSYSQPYVRPAFYSLTYPEKYMFTPDPIPPYWASLEGMTLAEALAWCSENGVTISGISYIMPGDERYVAELEGTIYEQSTRYGSLISEHSTTDVVVMGSGTIDDSKFVPNFVGHSYSKAVAWANDNGIYIDIDFDTDADGEVGQVVSQDPKPFSAVEDCDELKIKVKAGEYKITFDKNGHGSSAPSSFYVTTGDSKVTFDTMKDDGDYLFAGWWTAATGGTQVYSSDDVTGKDGSTITIYAHWTKLVKITLDENYDGGSTSSIKTNESLPTPTRSHYKFDGWYDAVTGGNKVTSVSSLTSDTILYAHWTEATKYSYSFVVDGEEIDSGEVYEGETPDLPEEPSKDGYDFVGWSPTVGPISSDTTYEAQWTYTDDCDSNDSCTLTGDEVETEVADDVGKMTHCVGTFNAVTDELISCSCDIYIEKEIEEAEPE